MAPLPLRKRLKLSPPDASSSETLAGSPPVLKALAVDDFFANASRWNLEQDYENRPRKQSKKEKANTRLPIKTAEGLVEQVEAPPVTPDEEKEDSWLGTDDEAKVEALAPQEPQRSSKEEIIEAKEEMARIASLINEDPEEHVGGFKTLAEFSKSANVTIKKLALVAQSAVFKDVIPGYRIRSLKEEDMTEKVSKEVRKLRAYEQGLVGAYQTYVKELAAYARGRGKVYADSVGLTTVSIACACVLVLAVPHFNFRGDLLKILVDKLSGRRLDKDYKKCVVTLEQLFREDDDGKPSQEAVAMITRMIKSRNYHVDESVLNTLLHLRLLTEFSSKASQNQVDKLAPEPYVKKPKQKRVFRTKKMRKDLKELKIVEKEFREADASVSHEDREKLQAETLKAVFATYFRILKARSPSLMGAVLEGLAKFAHLINQDFFGDLLIALQEIAASALEAMKPDGDNINSDIEDIPTSSISSNPHRTALLCTTTAFALLSSQDAATLHLDLSFFTTLLYTLLLPLATDPNLELGTKTLRLRDPHAHPDSSYPEAKVNATTLSTLLMRALAATLTPRNTPPGRLAAFVHRLEIFSLQIPEKTALATTTLLREVVRSQGRKVAGLWNSEERRGDGRFDALGGLETSRPFCGTVWAGELLRAHYSEGVSEGVREMEGLVGGFA